MSDFDMIIGQLKDSPDEMKRKAAFIIMEQRTEIQRLMFSEVGHRESYNDLIGKLSALIPIADTFTAMKSNDALVSYLKGKLEKMK